MHQCHLFHPLLKFKILLQLFLLFFAWGFVYSEICQYAHAVRRMIKVYSYCDKVNCKAQLGVINKMKGQTGGQCEFLPPRHSVLLIRLPWPVNKVPCFTELGSIQEYWYSVTQQLEKSFSKKWRVILSYLFLSKAILHHLFSTRQSYKFPFLWKHLRVKRKTFCDCTNGYKYPYIYSSRSCYARCHPCACYRIRKGLVPPLWSAARSWYRPGLHSYEISQTIKGSRQKRKQWTSVWAGKER